jgi:hypothetical protein
MSNYQEISWTDDVPTWEEMTCFGGPQACR